MSKPLQKTTPTHSEGPIATSLKPMQLAADVGIAVALLVMLLGVWAFDRRATPLSKPIAAELPAQQPDWDPPPPPPMETALPKDTRPPVDPTRRLRLQFTGDLRFGIMTTTGNPDDPNDDDKRLTYSVDGQTNNTRVWIDGDTPMFGQTPGNIARANAEVAVGRFESVWKCGRIQVTQVVEEAPGEMSRRMDTVRIRYRLENLDRAEHTVGLRIMLDTLIGSNDGVPFIVPGSNEIVTSPVSYRDEKIPDFVRALERPSLTDPGVIVDIGLRPDEGERPTEVALTHWPANFASTPWPGNYVDWEYDRTTEFGHDSAIGVYYNPRPLKPGESRSFFFTYGLGTISSTLTKNARLSLTTGGPFYAGGAFWLVALVQNPRAGQSVRLTLPEGLTLAPNEQSSKPVAASGEYSQLSWLVRIAPTSLGEVEVKATLEPEKDEERQMLHVQTPNAQLALAAQGPFQAGKSFWVVATVRHPRAGQSVALLLPDEIELAPKETAEKPVPTGSDSARVLWLVRVKSRASGNVDLQTKLLPGEVHASCVVAIQEGSMIQ